METHLTPENARVMREVRSKLDNHARGKNSDARDSNIVARAKQHYANRLSELKGKLNAIPRDSLEARRKANRDIQNLNRAFGVKSESYDNYGALDAFKSKEKRYAPKCGEVPVQRSSEIPEEFQLRVNEYEACVLVEEEIYKSDSKKQVDEVGSAVEQGKSLFEQIFGNKNSGGNQSGPIYYDPSSNESSERILGLPKVAFYSLLALVVILVVYLVFFLGKK